MDMSDVQLDQLYRLDIALITMTEEQKQLYLLSEDDIGEGAKGAETPVGYKRCGKCSRVKKFFLFNKNAGSRTNTSGNCKICQKDSAAGSYKKTKSKRNYKKYYQENKEIKQQHARKYYNENKDSIKEKHKDYLQTSKGQKVMKKAHDKRRKALSERKGIPFTRAMVIDRDGIFMGHDYPICYLCTEAITDISGEGLHIDHVIPVATDGLDCFTNVACSHSECNLRREKDARELKSEQIEDIITRAEAYIDANPDKFPD